MIISSRRLIFRTERGPRGAPQDVAVTLLNAKSDARYDTSTSGGCKKPVRLRSAGDSRNWLGARGDA